ncbi:MAG: hypothetical protein JWQ36_1556, partial [Enterovirga sp.]|nr:hypothetical protein [Enterovirga sp.]
HRLLGTDAAVIARLKDPLRLASLLAELGIPHPPLSLVPVPREHGWLRKRVGGSGGRHIRAARPGERLRAGEYLQQEVRGRPVSVAVLADGRGCDILGFSEQWTAPSRSAPFRYGGAVAPAALAPELARGMAGAAAAVAAASGLRGLASADFLVDDSGWWLLEINPRPGATLDLLDRGPTPLLLRHIEACAGGLGQPESAPAGAAASAILYASRTIRAVPVLAWPDHVADRPRPGSRIAAGAPICTVAAEAPSARAARALLQTRCAAMRSALERKGHEDGWTAIAPQRECTGRAAR